MKTAKVSWDVTKIARMAHNGKIRFDYPIQRKSGQWDKLQMSLLIHSIVGSFPIPPVLILKSENIEYVLDGKQRLTNIINYISGVKDEDGNYPENAFPLHEMTPNVKIDEYEKEYELAGKYFDELDEEVQREISGMKPDTQRLEDATDDEIEELFYRWNNGTPLTKQQKARAKMGTQNAIIIDDLLKHKFISEVALFTPLQQKRSDDEAVILQALMLLSGMEIESFVADKLLQFATDTKGEDISEITKSLEEALDYMLSTGVSSPIFKKLHLPTLLFVAKKAHDKNVDPNIFGEWIQDFALAINNRSVDKALVKTDYRDFTGAGSVKGFKVLGRKNSMLTHFETFLTVYTPPVEEESPQPEVEEQTEENPDQLNLNDVITDQKEVIIEETDDKEPILN